VLSEGTKHVGRSALIDMVARQRPQIGDSKESGR
jgi:hypothetical protein